MELPFDVVDLDPADPPEVGDPAPEFTRPLVGREYWEDTALSALTAAGPVLLVFMPMPGSFPATYICSAIADRGWTDAIQVVGVSIGTPYATADLLDDHDLDARIYSDPANDVAAEYGLAHDLDGMTGLSEPRPATVLLDESGVVRHTWVATEWPEFPDYDTIEAALDDLDAEA
ncbi:redoxin domain-containing protein [Halococcoides cellulosivorans]|uniref:Peroxiredoxin n=1 Tax=Halococcoides cellulosivorans TaxID=1679096 RepID=A0A2R4WYT1_9EURY|nr:redoxin domain-containing protein [Halococcoides cellulosivorans]AWB26700.1 peroxiredoxin [Halococcoides cellulosivorans]